MGLLEAQLVQPLQDLNLIKTTYQFLVDVEVERLCTNQQPLRSEAIQKCNLLNFVKSHRHP